MIDVAGISVPSDPLQISYSGAIRKDLKFSQVKLQLSLISNVNLQEN